MNLAALQNVAKSYSSIKRGNHVGSDYTSNEKEFLQIVQDYKSHCYRPYPTWREVFALVGLLGYKKEQ